MKIPGTIQDTEFCLQEKILGMYLTGMRMVLRKLISVMNFAGVRCLSAFTGMRTEIGLSTSVKDAQDVIEG